MLNDVQTSLPAMMFKHEEEDDSENVWHVKWMEKMFEIAQHRLVSAKKAL